MVALQIFLLLRFMWLLVNCTEQIWSLLFLNYYCLKCNLWIIVFEKKKQSPCKGYRVLWVHMCIKTNTQTWDRHFYGYYWDILYQGLAEYFLLAKSAGSCFINKVLADHSYANLFPHCLWLLSHYSGLEPFQ